MTNTPRAALYKSARLVILREWQEAGKLDGLSAAKIRLLFPHPRPSRMTIYRDLIALRALRRILAKA